MDKHKCIKCGYLAVRNKKSRQLEEMEAEARTTGAYPYDASGVYDKPICFAQARDLDAEQGKVYQARHTPGIIIAGDTGISPADILAVITKERECQSFTAWQQGFSPKEHRDIEDREESRKWQARQRRTEGIWHIVELVVVIAAAASYTVWSAFISRGGK